jgi:hypothetical protein
VIAVFWLKAPEGTTISKVLSLVMMLPPEFPIVAVTGFPFGVPTGVGCGPPVFWLVFVVGVSLLQDDSMQIKIMQQNKKNIICLVFIFYKFILPKSFSVF